MQIDKINTIIHIMEKYFANNKTVVPIDYLKGVCHGYRIYFTSIIDALETNPSIFYKCTANRYALTKWIFEIINGMFEESNGKPIFVEEIYKKLRIELRVISLSRSRLKELLNVDRALTVQKFYNLQIKRNASLKYFPEQQTFIKNDMYFSNNLKNVINNILDDEIFKEVAMNTKQDTCPLSDKESEIVNGIIVAKDELGVENCRAFIKDPHLLQTAYRLLFPLANIGFINSINPANYKAKIRWLIQAYSTNDEIRCVLTGIFDKYCIHCPADMKALMKLFFGLDDIEIDKIGILVDFIKWLSKDLRLYIYDELNSIFANDRSKEIILYRAQGHTLESAGKKFGLTRERIRQIEKRIIDKFNNHYMKKIRPQYILFAFSDIDYLINEKLIDSIYHDLARVFEYSLHITKDKSAIWSDELEGFINDDDNWYDFILRCIDSFPEVLNAEELDQKVFELYASLKAKVDFCIIKRIIEKSYKVIGNTFTRTRMSKNQMYLVIIDKYFQDGIKVFDDFEMMRFRNYFRDEFGDIELPNNRAIAMRMTHDLVLCDRGKYILPDRINIPDDLLEKISNYIKNSNKDVIMYYEIFEVFKRELLQRSNINNRYFLQGVLKYKHPNSFIYTRDTICKESAESRSIHYEIEEFIKNANGVVTKDDIRKAFPGITDIIINLHIASNEDVLLWDFGKYIHVSKLNIDEDIIDRLKSILKEYTKNGTVSVRKIYDELFVLENEFVINNNIANHIALFSLFQYLFGDEYEFSRPYIAPKDSTTLSEDALIREYVSSFDQITISDLKTYLDDMHIRIMNYSVLLNDLSKEFLRVDDDLLIRKDKLELSEETIDRIEEVLLALMGQTRYISSRVLFDFSFFPNVGVKWTPFLLVSIIKSSGKRVKTIDMNMDYRYLSTIFVDNSLDILDYDSLLYYAIKEEAITFPFRSKTEIERFLKERGLISKSIPDSLLEKGYLVSDGVEGIRIF